MDRRTIPVGWEHEVPVEEVEMFREQNGVQLEHHFGTPACNLTDSEVARYMVKISHPSPRYLKAGFVDLCCAR